MANTRDFRELFDMYERMFLDEQGKDVAFELADGREQAHSSVLRAASDVFAGMLKQEMREKSEGVVSLSDVGRVPMRIFLRLIYTGHVDPSDWALPEEEQSNDSIKVLRQANMTVELPRLTSREEMSSVLLDIGESLDFEFTLRSENWLLGEVMIGVARADSEIIPGWPPHGYYAQFDRGIYRWLCHPGGIDGGHLCGTWPSPLPAQASVVVRFANGDPPSLMFSVDGSPFAVATFKISICPKAKYCPVLSFGTAGFEVEVVSSCPVPRCPLEHLLTVAALARKYMVRGVVSMTTEVLKARLSQAKGAGSVDAFEQILGAAIAADMGAVRMSALDCARDFAPLRKAYDEESLRPEVRFELGAIWPPPTGAHLKRARLD